MERGCIDFLRMCVRDCGIGRRFGVPRIPRYGSKSNPSIHRGFGFGDIAALAEWDGTHWDEVRTSLITIPKTDNELSILHDPTTVVTRSIEWQASIVAGVLISQPTYVGEHLSQPWSTQPRSANDSVLETALVSSRADFEKVNSAVQIWWRMKVGRKSLSKMQ